MRAVLIVASVVAVGFLIMVAYLYLNQRNMTYFPSVLDRSLDHVQRNRDLEWSTRVGNITLHGWLLRPGNSKLIIYYGGNAEELSWNIDEFHAVEDYAVLLMNYRGFGESEGSPTEKDLVKDALKIFDQVGGRYETIILIGRSLGSGIAVQVASQRNVDRLVLVTPYDSIESVAQRMYPWAPVSWFIKDSYDSMAASEKVKVPALFLVAEFDEIIPPVHARRLADAWKSAHEWVLIENADHNSITGFPEYWNSINRFIREDSVDLF